VKSYYCTTPKSKEPQNGLYLQHEEIGGNMKKYLILLAWMSFCTFAITGCVGVSQDNVGTVPDGTCCGYASNALTGGSTLGTVTGTLGGAYLGNQAARNLGSEG
jgi:hypothetical protein